MAQSLVIVESPAKAKTINRYLGPDYIVRASMGHVRDLPKKGLGVDVEHDFAPTYQVIEGKGKVVAELKREAHAADRVILAADPDREGEAISWHLSELIGEDNPHLFRATFNEITEDGIHKAFEHLGELNVPMIEAQQTRRILDRLVGYKISPLLWKKVGKGLSAGRVQSVALRLIVDREREIKAFVPEEYWTIVALLGAAAPPPFRAPLATIDGKKARVGNGDQAREIVEACRRDAFVLAGIRVREKHKSPPPPYITSTLQQDGFRLLRYPVKKTMFIAQKLYEGLPLGEAGPTGLITYMRTDSFRVADEALAAVRHHIAAAYGHDYVPHSPHHYKSKGKAQDAHEAIRPAHLDLPPDKVKPFLKKEELALYKMIWNRFVASQMASALIEETEFDIRNGRYGFKAKGEVIKFKGFLAVLPNGAAKKIRQAEEASGEAAPEAGAVEERPEGVSEEAAAAEAAESGLLPPAKEGETLRLFDLESKQKFTEPPPRYTEGTLVKELEARGIGRPSTYAPTLSTLQDRVYVVKDEGKFAPTDLGMFVTDFLVEHFPDLMQYEFTAKMEENLDRIGDGEAPWLDSLKSFYDLLLKDLKKGEKTDSIKKEGIPVEGEACPKCGKPLVIKEGRFGRFKACTGYPECQFKQSLVKKEAVLLEETCPECGKPLARKIGRFGPFVSCSDYPTCKYIKKDKPVDTGHACPRGCGGTLLQRKSRKRGRIFYGCSLYPKCNFVSWDEPAAGPCPKCGAKLLFIKRPLKGEPFRLCKAEGCEFSEKPAPAKHKAPAAPAAPPAPAAPEPPSKES